MESLLIKAQNVCVFRSDNMLRPYILKDVSLEVFAGQIVTIIGPNGAGKTTLLKVLLGLVNPSKGQVLRSQNLKIGYMPQRLKLNTFMPMIVERFLSLASQIKGKDLSKKIEQVLWEVGADHLKDRNLSELSGGEFQRVLLAQALMNDPALLVLDEPTQGVDVIGQEDLYTLVTQLRDQRHCGIVLVSHDLNVVMASSDIVLCLNGHVCCSGHPTRVVQDPEYRSLFQSGGAARQKTGLVPYQHHHDHRHDHLHKPGESCQHD
jgi:zinc transport system ATP-binding protein